MQKRELNVNFIPAIRRLQIAMKGKIAGKIGGEYKSIFKGKGLVFSDYRDYTPSDDASLIDWKATAKSDKILVREYEEERKLNVFFLIDTSSSMIFGSTKKLKNEYAAELIASLAYVILDAGDKIGFAFFNNTITKKFLPETGQKQFYVLTKNLIQADNYGGHFYFSEALNLLMNFLKSKSLLIIVSDFIGINNNWKEDIKVTAKKHDVIAFMVRDPRDESLPSEDMQISISDPYSNKQILINPLLIKNRYEDFVKKQKKEVTSVFTEAGVDFIYLNTTESFVKPVMDLFKRRCERWR